MATTTIRLPGTDGPDITIERGLFAPLRVLVDGQPVARDPARKDSYPIPLSDGTTRSVAIKSGWNGMVAVADDGSRLPLDPPRPLWESIIAFLPIGLVAIGGLIGGLVGGAGVGVNLAISRMDLRAPIRIGAMLAVLLAAALVWFIVARGLATVIAPVPSFAAGECVDGVGVGASIDTADIRAADCADPHQGEVVGIGVVDETDDGAFAGFAAMEAIAEPLCRSRFEQYVGIGYESSRLEMLYLYPSGETWGRGDRQIACIAIGAAGAQLSGSVAGTAE